MRVYRGEPALVLALGWTPSVEVAAGGTVCIILEAVVIGAVETTEFGGGVETGAELPTSALITSGTLGATGTAGMGVDMEEFAWHCFPTESYTSPVAHVQDTGSRSASPAFLHFLLAASNENSGSQAHVGSENISNTLVVAHRM